MKVSKFLLVLVLFNIGCSDSISSKKELIEFIQNNRSEFVKEKTFKKIKITAKCIPEEILSNASDSSFKGRELNFVFEIASMEQDFLRKFSQSRNEYQQFKWYLVNEGAKFIYLEQGDEKIFPDIAQFEERYELGKGCVYNIVFDRMLIDQDSKATLVYDDQVFGMGKLKFRFDIPLLTHIPINEKPYFNTL